MTILPAKYRRSAARERFLRSLRLAVAALGSVMLLSPALVRAAPIVPGQTAVGLAAPPSPTSRLAIPPIAPQRYRLPRLAIWVSNEGQLRRALARYTSHAIILRNGFYGGSEPYSNPGGDRLYAQTLGKAVLGAGITMGGASGPGGGVIQGIAFDVSDSSKTLQSSIVHVWGTGRNTRIVDVTLEGHGVVGAGIMAREVGGPDRPARRDVGTSGAGA